jgi:ABC-type sulfate/molybdate transport systems ATPase subunit
MRFDLVHPRVTAGLSAEPGQIVALVGPNGAGKTSLLRALVGLLPVTGMVEVAGRDVSRLPVHERRIGWVPQEPSLFAHLSAIDNVGYPLRAQGLSRSAARREAQHWLDRLDVGELSQRRPAALSGGQLARISLARALAGQPDLLLLDEPLAALDTETRDDVRRLLRRTLAGGSAPVLIVTHDPIDVVALADSLLVLEQGVVIQHGTPSAVAAAPRSTWVAALLGQNAWQGRTDATGLQVNDSHISAAEPLVPGLEALALCQPSAVTLHRQAPSGSARTVMVGEVGDLRSFGGRVRVCVLSDPPITADVTVAAAVDLHLAEGGRVWAALKATEVTLVAL